SNDQPWQSLWMPMTLLNVWRIPLSFFVSGMGVYFALRKRTWGQVVQERAKRILLPFPLGIVAILPLPASTCPRHYHFAPRSMPRLGHLWFLGNLFSYVLILSPAFYYLKLQEGRRLAHWAERIMRTPLALLPVFALFIGEVLTLRPVPFEMYA